MINQNGRWRLIPGHASHPDHRVPPSSASCPVSGLVGADRADLGYRNPLAHGAAVVGDDLQANAGAAPWIEVLAGGHGRAAERRCYSVGELAQVTMERLAGLP